MTIARAFAGLLVTTLAAAALGAGLCLALDLALSDPASWLCLAAGAVIASAAGAAAMSRPASKPAAVSAPEPREGQRKLRHDVRGALSPALLMADRLVSHDDPGVQRAGDVVVRSIEKAVTLLADTPAPGLSPPDPS